MIIKRDFVYTPKGKNRPLHIHLPEGYFDTDARYPVMYFFDGHNLFSDEDATYGKSWGMQAFLKSWPKDMIIVGIECGHEGYERLSEYLPYPAVGYFGQFEPWGEKTMEWIVHEIKPMIDREYRTIPFRECTAIGGSSMGGIMSLYAAVHYNAGFPRQPVSPQPWASAWNRCLQTCMRAPSAPIPVSIFPGEPGKRRSGTITALTAAALPITTTRLLPIT